MRVPGRLQTVVVGVAIVYVARLLPFGLGHLGPLDVGQRWVTLDVDLRWLVGAVGLVLLHRPVLWLMADSVSGIPTARGAVDGEVICAITTAQGYREAGASGAMAMDFANAPSVVVYREDLRLLGVDSKAIEELTPDNGGLRGRILRLPFAQLERPLGWLGVLGIAAFVFPQSFDFLRAPWLEWLVKALCFLVAMGTLPGAITLVEGARPLSVLLAPSWLRRVAATTRSQRARDWLGGRGGETSE